MSELLFELVKGNGTGELPRQAEFFPPAFERTNPALELADQMEGQG